MAAQSWGTVGGGVERTGAAGRSALVFEAADVLARVEEFGDIFEPALTPQEGLAPPG